MTICALENPGLCAERMIPVSSPTEAACQRRAAPIAANWTDITIAGAITCRKPTTRDPILAFTEIAPGVLVHKGAIADVSPENLGDIANIGLIIGTEHAVVIDAGGSRAVGEALWRGIRAHTSLPISHVILTHMHPDHVFGAAVFREAGAEIIGHRALPEALAARAAAYRAGFDRLVGRDGMLGSRIIAPDRMLTAPETLDLGGRKITLTPWPMAHTGTDVTVHDPETATLFAGDLVFDDHAPALDGSLLGWEKVLAQFDAIAPARVVPGHGGPVLPWPDGVAPLKRYLAALKNELRAAIAAGKSLVDVAETIGQDEADKWRLFDLFNARNATVAFTELEWE